MFQYACGRALAHRTQSELQFDLSFLESKEHDELHVRREFSLDIFGITGPIYEGNIHRDLTWISEQKFTYDPEILPNHGNVLLDGYWQSEKYFAAIAEHIWKQFSVRDLSRLNPKLVRTFRDPSSICVNVRRGDFVNNERSRRFHGVLGSDYMEQGVEFLAESVKNPKIFVFSDDVDWCREELRFPYPTEVIGHEHAGPKFRDYLHYMSLFNSYVIPNSSFAWWAVWLSSFGRRDCRVVAPKRWFLDESYCFDDLIPPTWHRI